MATVNLAAVDQRTAARPLSLRPHTARPKVIRRIVNLPESSRMRRPELEPTPLGTSTEQKRIEIFGGPLSTCSKVSRVFATIVKVMSSELLIGAFRASARKLRR
jgi:hypothetical protein